MKKLHFTLMIMLGLIFSANAQTLSVNLEECQTQEYFNYCDGEFTRIVVYAPSYCHHNEWRIHEDGETNMTGNVDSVEVIPEFYEIFISYYGCGDSKYVWFYKKDSTIPNPFGENPFFTMREGDTLTLDPGDDPDYTYTWDTGETGAIRVTEGGIYNLTVTSAYGCGTETFPIEVQENVEIYRATVNLQSNLNEVTWHVTDGKASYTSQVKVFRNNQLIATVPYTDGVFTDNIGSEATQWQYHILAVDNEGQDCPIPSFWKRTIHLDHVQGTQGNEILQWTPYAQEDGPETVVGYSIFDVVNGEPRLVITVGDFTNVFAYNPADFDGYGTVAAVFSRDGFEDLAFSNLTGEVLGLGEQVTESLAIYPNPATNGQVTLSGTGMVNISNTLGQTVKEMELNGVTSIELPSGIYLIRSGNVTKQVVVL